MKVKQLLATLAVSTAAFCMVACKTKNNNNDNGGQVITTEYEVSFVTNGGSACNTVKVESGSKVTLPTTTRDEYTFAGWYTNASLTDAFDENTPITGPLTLYAKWTKSGSSSDPVVTTEYEVSFVTNGGSAVSSISVAEGSTITTLPTTTKDGYTFAGWFIDPSCSTLFDQTTKITSIITLYAGWTQETSGTIVTNNGGYTEGLYAVFNETNPKSISIKVEYKLSTDTAYTRADSELVRATDTAGKARVDVVGLKAGNYDIKITNSASKSQEIKNIQVTADDRSGYAHWKNTTGVGAYNNDGTLKDNAVVVYVTDDTKNTVTATIDGKTYTGLVNIIKACDANKNVPSADNMASTPLDIRILGSIQTQQWNSKTHGTKYTTARQASLDETFDGVDWDTTTANELLNPGMTASSNYKKIDEADIISYGINSMSNDANNGITHLDGLTNNVLWTIKETTGDSKDQGGAAHHEYDSYYNELDVKFRENITVEGIGEDAQIYQWGFCFNQCNSVEVKNINFKDYTEDAIGIQGASDITLNSDYWIHNCTFDSGKNNWDVSCENDKNEGDGSTDFKQAHDLTISYCRYNQTHKTALVGSGSSSYQYNVTFHHNYYNQCGSRLPFTRNSNFHIYNCYYYGSTGTNMQINDTAYAFIEGCYFENTNKTFTTSNGVIKLYNNTVNSSSSVAASSSIVYATSRLQEVANNCKADKVTDFSKFDQDENLFYFDTTNNVSDVSLMLTSDTVKTYVPTVAGSGILAKIDYTKNTVEHNDAPVDTSTTATYTTTVPTSSGLYYTVTSDAGTTAEADLTSATSVKEDGGVITVTDTSATETTTGYYIFDDAKKYTTGTHTYTINLTLTGVGNNWYFLRVLNGNDEVLQLGTSAKTGTNKTGFISCIYNGTTTEFATTAFTANTTYTIVLTIDYDNDTANITIGNNTTQITNFNVDSITGFKLFTAKTAADRSFTVNSITVE